MAKNERKKAGLENAEMTPEGLRCNGFLLEPVIDRCEGCERIVAHENGQKYCTSFPFPARKWGIGVCNFATHVRGTVTAGKIKVNPLKASKRAARGR